MSISCACRRLPSFRSGWRSRCWARTTAWGLRAGGTLAVAQYDVEVVCRADSIPEALEVDIAALEIGSGIRLSDIVLPEGVRPAGDDDLLIVSVSAPAGGLDEDEPGEGDEEGQEGEEEGGEEPASD